MSEQVQPSKSGTLEFFGDVKLPLSVELGRVDVTVGRALKLRTGSVVELERFPDQPLEIRVSGKVVARGEIVVVNDHYGIRVTEIVSVDESLPVT